MKDTGDLTLERVLAEALEDEYRAQAKYRKIIEKFGPVHPFVNIVDAECRHISVLLPLFQQYGIVPPDDQEDLSDRVPDTLLEACEEGVKAELDNIALYDRLIAATEQSDVSRVLRNLQAASRDRHLPAFQRCVERGGEAGSQEARCTGEQKRFRRGWRTE